MNSSHVSFHNRIFHYSDFPFLCVSSTTQGKGRVLYVGNNNKMISQLSVGSQSHLVARMFCGCGIKLLNSKREHSIFEVKFLFNWGWCHKIFVLSTKMSPDGPAFYYRLNTNPQKSLQGIFLPFSFCPRYKAICWLIEVTVFFLFGIEAKFRFLYQLLPTVPV